MKQLVVTATNRKKLQHKLTSCFKYNLRAESARIISARLQDQAGFMTAAILGRALWDPGLVDFGRLLQYLNHLWPIWLGHTHQRCITSDHLGISWSRDGRDGRHGFSSSIPLESLQCACESLLIDDHPKIWVSISWPWPFWILLVFFPFQTNPWRVCWQNLPSAAQTNHAPAPLRLMKALPMELGSTDSRRGSVCSTLNSPRFLRCHHAKYHKWFCHFKLQLLDP